MDSYRWDNFLAILANASVILQCRDGITVGSYIAILDLHHGIPAKGYSYTLLPLALNEIERLRDFRAVDADLISALNDRLDEAESALADAGIARCKGDGCGKFVRAVLMRNGMCDDCANAEDEVERIFGHDQRAEDEAGYNQIVRDGLRWVR